MLSIDGFGDFVSAMWGTGTATPRDRSRRVRFPHSLGIFYTAVTQYLGFPNYGDEYKVMGLAPTGTGATWTPCDGRPEATAAVTSSTSTTSGTTSRARR